MMNQCSIIKRENVKFSGKKGGVIFDINFQNIMKKNNCPWLVVSNGQAVFDIKISKAR